MTLKTNPLKTLTTSVALIGLLLGTVGCGCNEDSTLTTLPQLQPAVMGVRSAAPAVPVDPPQDEVKPLKIDVTFVLDDSDPMNRATLGIIPRNDDLDKRERSQAAQAIMRSLEQNLAARLKADYLDSGVAEEDIPAFDFAFAVVRYEDFGGEFTNPNRRFGDVDAEIFGQISPENDMDARPYILNMPLLRQNHPEFQARFQSAIAREAPGDGNPRFENGATRIAVHEPQSGIEALYQLAAPDNGDGTFGGFDADGNGSTLGSGAPTSLDPARNPQTLPGATGDVPSVSFTLAAQPDPDGEDLYLVGDENKNPVTYLDAPGGNPVQSIASGNIGGVGWRPNSARFVILATDIATVAPTETTPQGTKEPLAQLPPPAKTEMVTSKDGAATPTGDPRDAPRGARSVLLGAFDNGFELLGGQGLIIPRRIGVAEGPAHEGKNGVAPVGAHTVQQAIDRLNELDIEVLLLGAPFNGGLDTKPGDTGVNGDKDSDIGNTDYDPSNPDVVQPDRAPWFWMSAVNRLTTPEITSIPDGGGLATYPAVYNLATVWPLNAADPEGLDESNVKHTVTDDLIERIRDWADNGYIKEETTGSGQTRPAVMPTLDFLLKMDLELEQGSDVVMASPLEGGLPKTHFETTISIPVYFSDEAAPAPIPVDLPVFNFAAKDDTVPLPANMLVKFTITAQLSQIRDQTTENEWVVSAITDYLIRRGNGADYDGEGNPIPLPDEFTVFKQAEGVALVTVRPPGDLGPTAQILTYTGGYFVLNDLAPGRDNSDQVGGTGTSWPPPPPDAD